MAFGYKPWKGTVHVEVVVPVSVQLTGADYCPDSEDAEKQGEAAALDFVLEALVNHAISNKTITTGDAEVQKVELEEDQPIVPDSRD